MNPDQEKIVDAVKGTDLFPHFVELLRTGELTKAEFWVIINGFFAWNKQYGPAMRLPEKPEGNPAEG